MSPEDARALIAHASLSAGSPQIWADLGCGDGTFTMALASVLPPNSTIHAIDTDKRALARIPAQHGTVAIHTHRGDFTMLPWRFDKLDGVLMANSLHYVKDKADFLRRAGAQLARKRVLVVEYDMTRGNPWVPYPLSSASAMELFDTLGYHVATPLGRRRSNYRAGELYGLLLTQ
jgi:trans-aconitate methyltransferase